LPQQKEEKRGKLFRIEIRAEGGSEKQDEFAALLEPM
jgi:hypothetical protein